MELQGLALSTPATTGLRRPPSLPRSALTCGGTAAPPAWVTDVPPAGRSGQRKGWGGAQVVPEQAWGRGGIAPA